MKNKIVFFPVKTVFRFHLNSKVDAWWTVGKYIFSRKREYRMLTSYSYVRFPLSKLTGEKIQSPNFTQNHLWKTNWKIKRSYFFYNFATIYCFFLSFNIKNYLHIQNKINLVFCQNYCRFQNVKYSTIWRLQRFQWKVLWHTNIEFYTQTTFYKLFSLPF